MHPTRRIRAQLIVESTIGTVLGCFSTSPHPQFGKVFAEYKVRETCLGPVTGQITIFYLEISNFNKICQKKKNRVLLARKEEQPAKKEIWVTYWLSKLKVN